MLLSWQTKAVITQSVENVETLHAFESRVHVGTDVAEWVSDVKARTRWVGEHVDHEQFRSTGDFVRLSEWSSGVRCLECAMFLPVVLPLGFNSGSERS